MSVNQEFHVYNIYINIPINKGDAIKVTSIPQIESFWLSVETIKDNGDLECKVQNNLHRPHLFKCGDIMTITSKSYIKEHKKESVRFIMNDQDKKDMYVKYILFKIKYGREPTQNDFDKYINIQMIE
jgi:hypothetical protein